MTKKAFVIEGLETLLRESNVEVAGGVDASQPDPFRQWLEALPETPPPPAHKPIKPKVLYFSNSISNRKTD